MSLTTAVIYCTTSPPLSGAMEDCPIVRVQQHNLSSKVLYVRVTTHVRLAVERSCCSQATWDTHRRKSQRK